MNNLKTLGLFRILHKSSQGYRKARWSYLHEVNMVLLKYTRVFSATLSQPPKLSHHTGIKQIQQWTP